MTNQSFYILAAMDLTIFILFYLFLSFITRDREDEEDIDNKLNRALIKIATIIRKFKINVITYIIFAFMMVKEALLRVNEIIISNDMTDLQKLSMLNICFVVIGIVVLMGFFEKVRLFKKRVEA